MAARDIYESRPVECTPEGVAPVGSLLRTVFPHATHLTDAYLDWQYRLNPAGPAIGRNAYLNGVLVAHYVTLPFRGRIDGGDVTMALSLNTATHPDHQGRGLFARLAEETYAAAAAAGHDAVIGVANANSTPGFTGKLGFQLVAPLEAFVGVGQPHRSHRPEEVGFERTWDRETMAWRLRNPSRPYRVRGSGTSFRVESGTDVPGIAALLGEFDRSLQPDETGAGTIGLRPLTLWIGLDPALQRGRRFLDVPRLLRPSPLNFIFRSLRDPGLRLSADTARIRALDFDPY